MSIQTEELTPGAFIPEVPGVQQVIDIAMVGELFAEEAA